jgi:hypothetical protein
MAIESDMRQKWQKYKTTSDYTLHAGDCINFFAAALLMYPETGRWFHDIHKS